MSYFSTSVPHAPALYTHTGYALYEHLFDLDSMVSADTTELANRIERISADRPYVRDGTDMLEVRIGKPILASARVLSVSRHLAILFQRFCTQ